MECPPRLRVLLTLGACCSLGLLGLGVRIDPLDKGLVPHRAVEVVGQALS